MLPFVWWWVPVVGDGGSARGTQRQRVAEGGCCTQRLSRMSGMSPAAPSA